MGKIYKITAGILSFLFIALCILLCIPETRTKIADYCTQYSDEYQVVTNELVQKEEEIAILQESVDEKTTQITNLNSQITTKTNQITTLTNEKNELQTALTEKQNLLTRAQTDLTSANTTIAGLEEDISDLEDEIEVLENTIETLTGNKTDLLNQLYEKQEELTVKIIALTIAQNNLENLTEEISSLENEVDELNFQLASANESIAGLTEELEEANNLIDELQARIERHGVSYLYYDLYAWSPGDVFTYSEEEDYWISNNAGVSNSSSYLDIYFSLNDDEVLKIDYFISSEVRFDYGYLSNGSTSESDNFFSTKSTASGGLLDERSGTLYLNCTNGFNSRTEHHIVAVYKKDGGGNIGLDCFKLRFSIEKACECE